MIWSAYAYQFVSADHNKLWVNPEKMLRCDVQQRSAIAAVPRHLRLLASRAAKISTAAINPAIDAIVHAHPRRARFSGPFLRNPDWPIAETPRHLRHRWRLRRSYHDPLHCLIWTPPARKSETGSLAVKDNGWTRVRGQSTLVVARNP